MRSLAQFVLAGPAQAVAVVVGFALLAFPFPVLIIFSGGALVLVGLQYGIKQSAQILLASVLILYVSAYFLFKTITISPLLTWLSATVVMYIYRKTLSINFTLQLLVIIGMAVVLLASIFIPNLQEYWLVLLQKMFKAVASDPSLGPMLENAKLTDDRVEILLPVIASVMTGGLVSIYIQTICAALFLGRWWQGLQDSIQPFRVEFIDLRLGMVLASLAILFVIAGLVVKYAIFWQLAFVCLSMFAIQGLAIVHALLGQLSNPLFGFVIVYGLLFLAAPQMVVALSAFGVMDSFLKFSG